MTCICVDPLLFGYAGQAAGIVDPNRDGEPTLALEALHKLKTRLETTHNELEDYKLKVKSCATQSSNSYLSKLFGLMLAGREWVRGLPRLQTKIMQVLPGVTCPDLTIIWCWQIKIVEEKQRLNELRVVHSPLKAIGSFGAQSLAPR